VISPSYILRGARGWERDLQHLGRLRTSLNSMGKGDRLRQSYTTQLATEEPLRPISSLGCGFGREPKARSKTSIFLRITHATTPADALGRGRILGKKEVQKSSGRRFVSLDRLYV
jgi:hypothetical protein